MWLLLCVSTCVRRRRRCWRGLAGWMAVWMGALQEWTCIRRRRRGHRRRQSPTLSYQPRRPAATRRSVTSVSQLIISAASFTRCSPTTPHVSPALPSRTRTPQDLLCLFVFIKRDKKLLEFFLAALHKCGPILHMSYYTSVVCMSVCRAHKWAVHTRLNRSTCRSEYRMTRVGPKNHMGVHPTGRTTFDRDICWPVVQYT